MKRFITIAEYARLTGLSHKTIKHGVETKQIPSIKTEAGLYKIDTAYDKNPDTFILLGKLENVEQGINALCRQFNIRVEGGFNEVKSVN